MNLPRLLAIVDVDVYQDDIILKAKKIIEKHKPTIMLRAKNLKGKYFYEYAKILRNITIEYDLPLIINERFDIALSVKANGVHLPSNALDITVVRDFCKNMAIGYSAHSKEEAISAQNKKADYITLSPIHPTKSHPDTKPLGIEYLKDVLKTLKIPVFALGGISKDNIQEILSTGVYGVASIRMFLE